MKKDTYNLDFSDKEMDDMEHLVEELLNNPEYKEMLNNSEYKNDIEEIENKREVTELREKEKKIVLDIMWFALFFVFVIAEIIQYIIIPTIWKKMENDNGYFSFLVEIVENHKKEMEDKEFLLINENNKEQTYKKIETIISIGITVSLCGIITIFLNKDDSKKINEEISNEEINKLEITPALVCYLFNENYDMRDVILSTIIDLHTRGNIEIVENNKIRFISFEGISHLENFILGEIFNFDFTQDTTFKKIGEIAKKYGQGKNGKKSFFQRLNTIRYLIISEISQKGILSDPFTYVNTFISWFTVLTILILPFIISCFTANLDIWIIIIPYVVVVLASSIVLNSYYDINFKIVSEKLNKKYNLNRFKKLFITIFGIIVLVSLYNAYSISLYLFILELYVLFVSAKIVLNNKGKVFSLKGKEERKKILKLKKYILESNILYRKRLHMDNIWDKYLAYGIALGIDNQITESIYPEWEEFNIK